MRQALVIPLVASVLVARPAAAEDQPMPKKLPAGFTANLFAAPPLVNYPTFIVPGEEGELFVSVDKNGSLDRVEEGRGFIVKLVDTDGDGKADKSTEFAKIMSPRGLEWDGEWLYCLHPPGLSRWRDTNGDGVADEKQDLVTGIGFSMKDRAPDHTSNGVTFGIDGWLYLAIGDFGFMKATGADGRTLQLHAGGVVRVRPDGSEMELFTRGTRNIYEVAVTPDLHLFTRDNTNDGGGWDTRVHALFFGADMGYPRLFKNFTDETMPTLGIYGGGSGVGGVHVQEPGFPKEYGDTLYTVDWGRNAVYRHPIKATTGAWFDIGQDVFCEIERPTCLKVDRKGQMFLSSWKGATFSYAGENVGYIVRIVHEEERKQALADGRYVLRDLKALPDSGLAGQLGLPSARGRFAVQREMVRRGAKPAFSEELETLVNQPNSGPAEVAALFTMKELYGKSMNGALSDIAAMRPGLKEMAVRALGDRPADAATVPTKVVLDLLKDERDLVKAQAVIALSRLGRKEAAEELLALAAKAPADERTSAVVEPRAATGNVKGTAEKHSQPLEADISGAKVLHLVVTDGGDGSSCDHADWVEPLLSGPGGEKKLTELKWTKATAGWSETRVGKNAIGQPLSVDGQAVAWGIGTHAVSVISYDLPANHGWTKFTARGALDDSGVRQNREIGSVQFQVYVDDLPASLRGAASRSADEQATDASRSLPHLASRALISLKAWEACFKALDTSASDPGLQEAALRVLRNLHEPEVVAGVIERLGRTQDEALRRGLLTVLVRLHQREAEWDGSSWGTRPDTTGPYYKRTTWAESGRIEDALRAFLEKADVPLRNHVAQQLERHRVTLKSLPMAVANTDPQWQKDQQLLATAMAKMADMKQGDLGLLEPAVAVERTLAALEKGNPDPKRGEKLFTTQGCAACHVMGKDDPPKGPNLYDIARRYSPTELISSIMNPGATVSQGFPTHIIETKDGQAHMGFALKESGDEIILRTMAALTVVVPKDAVKTHQREEKVSSMTPGLVNNLKPEQLADLLKYFQSVK